MNTREVWDAYDSEGNKLGFDLFRDEAEQIPQGVFHLVAEVVTVTRQKQVLITQRDPRKPFGMKWEFTGGSVLKGETAEVGAARELREETGILQMPEDLTFLLKLARGNSLYYLFIHTVENDSVPITLQEGETVAYRFIPAEALKSTVESDEFALPIKERFPAYEESLFAFIETRTEEQKIEK